MAKEIDGIVYEDPEWKGTWGAALVTCVICSTRWAAVFPSCAPKLECPGCGHMNEVPPFEEVDRNDEEEDDDG